MRVAGIRRLAVSALAVVALAGSSGRARQATAPAAGEARVRYLSHAGWLVETAGRVLVFDYARQAARDAGGRSLEDGWLAPETLAGRPVIVFISHAHGDHYDPAVLMWATRVEDLTFVFGWAGPAGPKRVMAIDREPRVLAPGITVSAVQHDFDGIPESAFLVRTDGLVIYHSGDHATVSDPPNPAFTANIDALARQVARVDLAFISIFGGGTGRWVNGGDRYTIERLRPRVVFPMHGGGREHEYAAFAREARRLDLDATFAAAEHPGQVFHYRDGRLD